jgi:hypothetical protein
LGARLALYPFFKMAGTFYKMQFSDGGLPGVRA